MSRLCTVLIVCAESYAQLMFAAALAEAEALVIASILPHCAGKISFC
jgi:hypothetical protein